MKKTLKKGVTFEVDEDEDKEDELPSHRYQETDNQLVSNQDPQSVRTVPAATDRTES